MWKGVGDDLDSIRVRIVFGGVEDVWGEMIQIVLG